MSHHPGPAIRLAATAALVVATVGCGGEGASQGVAAQILLDSSSHYQRMTGWEATTQAGQDQRDFPRYRDRLLELAADSLGIDRVRLQVRSGEENSRDYWAEMRAGRLAENWRCVRYATVNDNADPNVINWNGFKFGDLDESVEQIVLPLKRRLEARGEHLFVNLNYVAFYRQCPNVPYIHTDPEEYAEFMLAASLHLRTKYGLVPDAWEVMLEPDNTPFWRGEQLGRAIVATARRLKAEGFTPRFIAPSTTSMGAAAPYFDELAQVPGALEYVSELSYHRYRDAGEPALRAIAASAARYHVASAMLEHIGSDQDDLYRDITIGGVSAWQQFVLAYAARDNGAQYFVIGTSGAGAPTVTMGSRTRYLRQYFHYIRAGALRLGASTSDPGMAPLAFRNANGRFVVVVKAGHRGNLAVAGLPPGRYAISYATADTLAPERVVTLRRKEPLAASIPLRGVLTIAQQ